MVDVYRKVDYLKMGITYSRSTARESPLLMALHLFQEVSPVLLVL
jgi:hypothetical protein